MTARLGLVLTCPTCGYRTDSATAVGARDITPKAGDVTLCLRCGQLLFFALDLVGLRFRLPTETELEQLHHEPKIQGVLDAFRAAFDLEPREEVAS